MAKVSFVALCMIVLISGFAGATNLYPTDDIYIDTVGSVQHEEGDLFIANYPDEPAIYQTMMKFDLTAYDGMYIDEALLWVYRYYGCSHGFTHVEVYAIEEDWQEQSWPLNEYVTHGETMWSEGILSQIGWNIIDVTYLVNTWTTGDYTNNGMVLVGEDDTRMSKLYSSEMGNGYEPYLQMPTIISADENNSLPSRVEMTSYPNPFNARVNISFTLTQESDINLEVFNILGQKVVTLANGSFQPGSHNVSWNADGNPTGMYFYRLTTGDSSITKRMLYLK